MLAVSLLIVQLFPGVTPRASELTEESGRLVRAVDAVRNEDYGQAVRLLEDYPEDKTLSGYSRYLLSRVLTETGKYRRALDVLDGIPAGSTEVILNYEKYYLEAKIHRGMGRTDRALELAENARQFVVRDEEKENLHELEFAIASSSAGPQIALEKAIDLCNAIELRFIGKRRDKLFEEISGIVDRIEFTDGQGLEDLYRYIELLVDYGEYRRARSHLLRNMGKWEGSLRREAYFRLAWLDGFKLDFPEEARWTFRRLLGTLSNSQEEARARYYLALFKDRTENDYDFVQGVMEVNRKFPQTRYGKLAAKRAFKERTDGAGLATLDNQLEVFKSALSRSAVREATWELFYRSFTESRYDLARHYLRKLESFYEETPPEIVFWRYKTREQSGKVFGEYLKLVGTQKDHPLNYYSLLAEERGWSGDGFSLDETWVEADASLSEREEEIANKDLDEATKSTLQIAIKMKNHDLYLPALSRLERIKSGLEREDYLFLKSQWESLAGKYRKSLKTSTQLLTRLYERNRIASTTVVKSAFPTYYGSEVERMAGKFGVPEALVFAVIRQESAFDAEAYSTSGAQSLMQVMPATARGIATDLNMEDYESDDAFKPPVNIEMGTYYVAKQVSRWGDIRLGLTAYHGGPGNLGKWKSRYDSSDLDVFLENIPAGSTRNYVKAVYRNYLVYKELL
ncbi:lytic transglycosylase domain-containing protein [Candidatus Bipolaricaulota bacterium]|nr:lytic transglycosylase domain-containing protein [Candidatus Bipolaricaulota bacterium]